MNKQLLKKAQEYAKWKRFNWDNLVRTDDNLVFAQQPAGRTFYFSSVPRKKYRLSLRFLLP